MAVERNGWGSGRRTATGTAARLVRRMLILTATLLLATPLWAQQLVRMGVYQNSPKADYTTAGRPEGIFIDVIEAIARKNGWSIEYVPGTWQEGLDRLVAGEIDPMPDVARTPAGRPVFVPQGARAVQLEPGYAGPDSVIRSLLDLQGKRVAVLEGSMHEGTGLGLAICQRLTALRSGTIEARSVLNQGSVFTVTLPLNEHKAELSP